MVRYASYPGWAAPGLATTHTFSNKTSLPSTRFIFSQARTQMAPLLYQLFRRELRFFYHCDGGVRTPVGGMVSQKYYRSHRSAVRWAVEIDLRDSTLHYTIVTRDDKRDKFTLQTDLSKCGHGCEPRDRLLSLAMRAKVKATTSIVVALSIQ